MLVIPRFIPERRIGGGFAGGSHPEIIIRCFCSSGHLFLCLSSLFPEAALRECFSSVHFLMGLTEKCSSWLILSSWRRRPSLRYVKCSARTLSTSEQATSIYSPGHLESTARVNCPALRFSGFRRIQELPLGSDRASATALNLFLSEPCRRSIYPL